MRVSSPWDDDGTAERYIHPCMYVCIDCKSLLIFSDRCVCVNSIGSDDDDETTKIQRTLNSLLHTNGSPESEREGEWDPDNKMRGLNGS